MDSVQVRGAEQLAELGKRLKEADATVLRQDLRRNIRTAVRPVKTDVQASLRSGLPHRGGLAALMGRASVGVRVRTEGSLVGVRIVAQKKGHDLRAVDRGRIRHPTFGHQPWVFQSVTPHLVTDPVEKAMPAVRAGVLAAMDHTASQITN